MMDGLLIRSLDGGLQGPLESTVSEQSPSKSDLPQTYRESHWWVFRRINRLEITDGESIPTRVRERVYLGPRWVAAMLITTAVVCLGVVGTMSSTVGAHIFLSLKVVGAVGMLLCWRATLVGGLLSGDALRNPTEQIHLVGPFVGTVLPVSLAVVSGGPIGVLAALTAITVAAASGVDTPLRDRLQSISTQVHHSVPLIPTIHVAYTLAATALVSIYLNQLIRVAIPWGQLLGALLLTTVGTGLAIGGYRTREESRYAVVITAGLTAVSVLVVAGEVITTGVAITTPLQSTPLVIIGAGIAAVWLIAVSTLSAASVGVYRHFETTGRQTTTRLSSLFAYLAICSSGAVLVSGGVYLVVTIILIRGDSTVGIASSTLLGGTPFVFFCAGITYQLLGTLRNVRSYREGSTTSTDSLPPIPFEPAYPVRILDADGFLATAYADPTTAYIAISETTVKKLAENELAALIAHEESHIHHRGAFLQVIFAIAPTVGLMGKNVIFGLYDFLTREYTADEYAIARLNDAGINGKKALTQALVSASDIEPADDTFIGFLPTGTTISTQETTTGPIDRIFSVFFGHFAGGIHPSLPRRLTHISETDDDLSRGDIT